MDKRLDQLLRMLATDNAGERDNAVVALKAHLAKNKMDFNDLADKIAKPVVVIQKGPEREQYNKKEPTWTDVGDPEHMMMASYLMGFTWQFKKKRDADFVESVYSQLQRGRILSPAQLGWLTDLYHRWAKE